MRTEITVGEALPNQNPLQGPCQYNIVWAGGCFGLHEAAYRYSCNEVAATKATAPLGLVAKVCVSRASKLQLRGARCGLKKLAQKLEKSMGT